MRRTFLTILSNLSTIDGVAYGLLKSEYKEKVMKKKFVEVDLGFCLLSDEDFLLASGFAGDKDMFEEEESFED